MQDGVRVEHCEQASVRTTHRVASAQGGPASRAVCRRCASAPPLRAGAVLCVCRVSRGRAANTVDAIAVTATRSPILPCVVACDPCHPAPWHRAGTRTQSVTMSSKKGKGGGADPDLTPAGKRTKAKLEQMMNAFDDFEGVMKEGTRVRASLGWVGRARRAVRSWGACHGCGWRCVHLHVRRLPAVLPCAGVVHRVM